MQSQYESVLHDSTTFPRAGSTNERYFHSLDCFDSSILEFVDGAMENWRLQGSDPVDAKVLVQVLHFSNAILTIRLSIVRLEKHFNHPV